MSARFSLQFSLHLFPNPVQNDHQSMRLVPFPSFSLILFFIIFPIHLQILRFLSAYMDLA